MIGKSKEGKPDDKSRSKDINITGDYSLKSKQTFEESKADSGNSHKLTKLGSIPSYKKKATNKSNLSEHKTSEQQYKIALRPISSNQVKNNRTKLPSVSNTSIKKVPFHHETSLDAESIHRQVKPNMSVTTIKDRLESNTVLKIKIKTKINSIKEGNSNSKEKLNLPHQVQHPLQTQPGGYNHNFNFNLNLQSIQLNSAQQESTKVDFKNDRKFSILDIASEALVTMSKEVYGKAITQPTEGRDKKARFSPEITYKKSSTSMDEAVVAGLLNNFSSEEEKKASKQERMEKRRRMSILITSKQKALFLLIDSRLLPQQQKINICLGSKRLYNLFKDRLLKDYTDELIIKIKVINNKYPDKMKIKTELSNWVFKFSLTSQFALNHLTQSSERTVSSLISKHEVKSIVEVIFMLFSVPLSSDFTNSLLLLLASCKAECLSKNLVIIK